MVQSVENFIILSKRRYLEELQRLAYSCDFVETIGLVIHLLQAERGASCLYTASVGKRFAKERAELAHNNQDLDKKFKLALELHLDHHQSAGAKQLSLISWILLGFDELAQFRHQVTLLKVSSPDCMQFFTQRISYLVSLIFEITDNTVESKISKHLVSLYNLVQAKEFAGQERAVGSQAFGSGLLSEYHHQRLLDLSALQDRHAELFYEFATPALKKMWDDCKQSILNQQHSKLKAKLVHGSINQPLRSEEGQTWFNLSSERLGEIWKIQCDLVNDMHHQLDVLIAQAEKDLQLAEQSLKLAKEGVMVGVEGPYCLLEMPQAPNSYTIYAADDYSADGQVYPMASVIHLLQQQSAQIAEIEHELSATKKALNERKYIERAKGVLMRQLAISEEEAYKILRTTAMEQNRKIFEVAESIIEITP